MLLIIFIFLKLFKSFGSKGMEISDKIFFGIYLKFLESVCGN